MITTNFENLSDLKTIPTQDKILKNYHSINFIYIIFQKYIQTYQTNYTPLTSFLWQHECLCKVDFSYDVATKSKYRNRNESVSDIRIQISDIIPDFKIICDSKNQTHRRYRKLKMFYFWILFVWFKYFYAMFCKIKNWSIGATLKFIKIFTLFI